MVAIIYLKSTIDLMLANKMEAEVDILIKSGKVFQLNDLIYLKIEDNGTTE